MQTSLTNNEFILFKKYIADKCGIDIPEEKSYLIETRLAKFLVDSGKNNFEELYHSLMLSTDMTITEKIIDAITTNETFWFRDKSPWGILDEKFMPDFINKLRMGKKQKIRIWSAASSTGQEAYSTAMFIDNWIKKHDIKDISLSNFEIIATDISNAVLEMAKKGRYDAISVMRGLDAYYKEAYFKKDGTVWEIDDAIKKAVKFQKFNLQNSYLGLGKFDVIFCRYVLIYFSDAFKTEVVAKIAERLENDGVLFLGSSELYADTENHFNMVHSGAGTYYTRRV